MIHTPLILVVNVALTLLLLFKQQAPQQPEKAPCMRLNLILTLDNEVHQ